MSGFPEVEQEPPPTRRVRTPQLWTNQAAE